VLHILARRGDALGGLRGILRILNPCVSCLSLPLLHKPVTPSDYSLPGGSSPIASALARRCWEHSSRSPSSYHAGSLEALNFA
jgi:hypothetical protein